MEWLTVKPMGRLQLGFQVPFRNGFRFSWKLPAIVVDPLCHKADVHFQAVGRRLWFPAAPEVSPKQMALSWITVHV